MMVVPPVFGGVDFGREVQPILSEYCYQCHGPDEEAREGDLRLDTEEGLLGVIGRGDVQGSELVKRIRHTDADELMPPPKLKRPLTAEQVGVLEQWISEGAVWGKHWAFEAIERPESPEVSDLRWGRNGIDGFVLAKLEAEGMVPTVEAEREILVRRLSLDLTGLPPTVDEVEAFLADGADGAYERLVERLLASPHFGERMAWDWLDAARYADTNGYQGDGERTMWPWRDWVVEAFNRNQGFDDFTRWQLAGDLLPEATREQILATGFNRNYPINGEGGRIPAENRVDYVMDMAETAGTVWLGLTMNCCRCHDHKFDPLSQEDYYSFYAFFNQTPVDGGGGNAQTPPVLAVASDEEEAALAELRRREKESEGEVLEKLKKERETMERRLPKVMVMAEIEKKRETRVLTTGLYNQPTDVVVTAAVPEVMAPEGEVGDRKALADWLVAEENPLTARVVANRFWAQFFGVGLVKTAEDFGLQGEKPSHPELLDWLAAEFRGSGWDVKGLCRTIVTSATYRQSSKATDELVVRDPENRLLARAARFRMPSWMLRDHALAASGLLVKKVGGAPAKPYQPPGVWAEASFGKKRYERDSGEGLYRRSLYTFWRRIVGPTMFFDSGGRSVCRVKAVRTNSPLHALTTLNDVQFVEAARVLAERVIGAEETAEGRIGLAFRSVLSRHPRVEELEVLGAALAKHEAYFGGAEEEAKALAGAGERAVVEGLDAAGCAAMTLVCSTIMNLDEALTRE